MPSLDRPLSGDVLVHDLAHELEETANGEILARNGRNARTLLKNGPLRVTLVALAAGGEIAEHHAEGPITVQPLQGRMRILAAGEVHVLEPGQLLSLAPGVRHAVWADQAASFLLTVASPAT